MQKVLLAGHLTAKPTAFNSQTPTN